MTDTSRTEPPVETGAAADERSGAMLITISASYGAGGSVVAPALAERLGLPLLHRATPPPGVLADPAAVREAISEEERRTVPTHRLLACLSHAMPAGPTMSPPSHHHQYEQLRRSANDELCRFAAGGGVILGRAAAVVLGPDRGFHVRLDGPPAARVGQGASIEGVDRRESRARLAASDRAREAYVRRLYDVDPGDASLYHLVIDSTVVSLDTVTELILTSVREARTATPG